MAIGQKTIEISTFEGLNLSADLIGDINGGTARFPVSSIPQLADRQIPVESGSTVIISENQHLHTNLDVDNSSAAVVFNLPNSSLILPAQNDIDGQSVDRGGLFATATIGSAANPVSFFATVPGNLRAEGNPLQGLLSADTLYVGGSAAEAEGATVFIFKRAASWLLHCSRGWRVAVDGNEALVAGVQISTAIDIEPSQNRVITDADHHTPIWLSAQNAGGVSFQASIGQGIESSIVNDSASTVFFDFAGHTQVGNVNSVGAGEASTFITGPLNDPGVSTTNRRIIVKSSS